MTNFADISAFSAAIASLRIEVSQNEEGLYTVCSYSEPLFCYDAHDLEGVDRLVLDTLRSYAKHFYGIDDPDVSTHCSPVGEVIPVERSKQISTIQAVFDKAA